MYSLRCCSIYNIRKNPPRTGDFFLPHYIAFFTCAFALFGCRVPFHRTRFILIAVYVAYRVALVVFQVIKFALVHACRYCASATITTDGQFALYTELVLTVPALLGWLVCFVRIIRPSRVTVCCYTFAPCVRCMIPCLFARSVFNRAVLDVAYTGVGRYVESIFALLYQTDAVCILFIIPLLFSA